MIVFAIIIIIIVVTVKCSFFIFNFWSPGISFISSSPIIFESRTGLVDIYIGGCKCYILCVCVCVCVCVSSINYQCLRIFFLH